MLISVIVPVYNCEESLYLTMDGLLAQTHREIEIILVNDGSSDKSGNLCDKYANKDKRVVVIHQKNKGLSGARNSGIAIAKGNYISFIDAGDIVEPQLYESLLDYCNQGIDFIDYPYYVQNSIGERFPTINKVEKHTIFSRSFIDDEMLPCLLNLQENKKDLPLCFVWRMLFKKDIISSFNVLFDEGTRKWEDRDFIIAYLMHCDSVVFYDKPLYSYVCLNDGNSLSSYYYPSLVFERIRKMKEREELFAGKYSFDSDYYCNVCLRVFIECLKEIVLHETEKFAKEYILQVFSDEFFGTIIQRTCNVNSDLEIYRDWITEKNVEAAYLQLKNNERNNKTHFLNKLKKAIKKRIK